MIAEFRIAVLGGGISGLAAALAAARLGESCVLLEKDPETGGLWGSSERDGFIFDHGVHGLYAASRENEGIVSEVRSIAGDIFVEADKKTKILFRGKLINYPLHPGEFFTEYGREGFFWAATLLAARARVTATGEGWMRSFKDYIIGNFGGLLYHIYFEPYVKKVWGVDPAHLDLESVARRVKRIRVKTFAFQTARRLLGMAGGAPAAYDGLQPMKILYPRNGARDVVDALRREAVRRGAEIRAAQEVRGISFHDGRYEITTMGPSGRREVFFADSVVSSLPLPDLLRMLFPDRDSEARLAAAALRYRAIRILNIPLDCPRIFEAQWTYFQGAEFTFSRVNEYGNLSAAFCPPGKTSLAVEFNCDVGDRVWTMPEDELFELTVRELDQPIGPYRETGRKVRASARNWFSVKLSHGYPLMELETAKHLDRALHYVSQFPRLHTIGRQGRFGYVNGDECVKMAFAAVEEIRKKRDA